VFKSCYGLPGYIFEQRCLIWLLLSRCSSSEDEQAVKLLFIHILWNDLIHLYLVQWLYSLISCEMIIFTHLVKWSYSHICREMIIFIYILGKDYIHSYLVHITDKTDRVVVKDSPVVTNDGLKIKKRIAKSSMRKYHASDFIPCMLCPTNANPILVRNWIRHSSGAHMNFMIYRMELVRAWILCFERNNHTVLYYIYTVHV